MNKTYRNVVLAAAIGAATLGCNGDSGYEPNLDPALIESESRPVLLQDVAVLFGDIFKQLLGTLDMTATTTTSFTSDQTTIGKLVTDAVSQSDTASGISLVTSAECSKAGDFSLGAHFEDDTGATPGGNTDNDFIAAFSQHEVETSIRADFQNCEEWGRNDGAVDLNNPEVRLDKTKETFLNGIMDISFVSFPNAGKTGFELVADITLSDFSMSGNTDDIKDKGTLQFDGVFNVSLKSADTSNNDDIPFLANIGASFANTSDTKADDYSKISIDANGTLNTNSNFNEFSYDLDFKGSTLSRKMGMNNTFEYFATSNLKKTTKGGDFTPDSGELMIITPDGDAGTATVKNLNDTIVVEIDYNGQQTSCTFDELLAGSDNCSKPQ